MKKLLRYLGFGQNNHVAVDNGNIRQLQAPIVNHEFVTNVNGVREVRFVHVTSSKFRRSILERGLVRPRLQDLLQMLMHEYNVPERLRPEIAQLVERRPFGMNARLQFAHNPIYCIPMHEDYYAVTETFARTYANGGEMSRLCTNIIRQVLTRENQPLTPQDEYQPAVVIIKLEAEQIAAPLFDHSFVDEFQTLCAGIGENRNAPPGMEVRLNLDIHRDFIENIISIDEYRTFFHR